MRNLKSILLTSFVACGSIAMLSACNKNEQKETKIDSLKDCLKVLNNQTNYTLNVSVVKIVEIDLVPIKFTANFIGYDNKDRSNTDIIIKDSVGLYRLSYDTDYLSGEYLKDENGKNYTSLYDNSIVKTMYDVDTSYINSLSDDITELDITSKIFKLGFIQTVGFDASVYNNVSSLVATYVDDVLKFKLSFNGSSSYTYTLTDIGTTTSSNYDNFMAKSGKAFEPSNELKTFRTLLQSNNFMQNVFYFDNELEDNGFYYERYCFAPHYFYEYSLIDPTNMYGYIECNNSTLYGVYGFAVTNSVISGLSANAYFTRPDIVTFQHYPVLLKLLSNLEYIKEGSLQGAREDFPGSNKYYFANEYLIEDFETNFSLDQTDFVNFPCAGVEIEINLNYPNPSNNYIEEPVICFHYLFKYGTEIYDYPFPLFGFGKAKIAAFDSLYVQLNTD